MQTVKKSLKKKKKNKTKTKERQGNEYPKFFINALIRLALDLLSRLVWFKVGFFGLQILTLGAKHITVGIITIIPKLTAALLTSSATNYNLSFIFLFYRLTLLLRPPDEKWPGRLTLVVRTPPQKWEPTKESVDMDSQRDKMCETVSDHKLPSLSGWL